MILCNVNLTYIVTWLNENKEKKSGKEFTVSDVQGYIKRGRIPVYLGGNSIKKINNFSKSYNVI